MREGERGTSARLMIPLLSIERHVIFSQGEAHGFCDVLTLLGNPFESFIDRCIKVLLSTLGTHPGWYMIDIDRLAVEMKPSPDLAVCDRICTTLAAVGV